MFLTWIQISWRTVLFEMLLEDWSTRGAFLHIGMIQRGMQKLSYNDFLFLQEFASSRCMYIECLKRLLLLKNHCLRRYKAINMYHWSWLRLEDDNLCKTKRVIFFFGRITPPTPLQLWHAWCPRLLIAFGIPGFRDCAFWVGNEKVLKKRDGLPHQLITVSSGVNAAESFASNIHKRS